MSPIKLPQWSTAGLFAAGAAPEEIETTRELYHRTQYLVVKPGLKRNVKNRQDLQDFSGFCVSGRILKNPINPVYFPKGLRFHFDKSPAKRELVFE